MACKIFCVFDLNLNKFIQLLIHILYTLMCSILLLTPALPDIIQNVWNIPCTSVIVVMWDSLDPNVTYCLTVRNITTTTTTSTNTTPATTSTGQALRDNETCGIRQNYFEFSRPDCCHHDIYEFVVTGVNSIGRGPVSYPLQAMFTAGEVNRKLLQYFYNFSLMTGTDAIKYYRNYLL